MHTTEEQSWDRTDLWDEIAREIDEAYLAGQPKGIVKITLCDLDIPARISDGKLYVQIPFGFILEAVDAGIPESLRHLETRVSITSRATLSSTRLRGAFHRARMAVSGLVPGRSIR